MIRTETGSLGTDLRTLAPAFLAWWLGELGRLVPAAWRRALQGSTGRLVVELGPLVVVRRVTPDREQVVARLAAGDGLVAALADPGDGETALEVRLAPEQVLRRRLDLPLTRDRDLRPLLSFELERRTPLAAADLHFAARVLARDRPRRRMTVEVVLAKRATVDAASTAIEAWAGRTPSVAAPAEQPGGWAPMLVERRTRSPASTRRRQLLAGLTCLATLLLIGLVLADAGRRAAETAALQAQLVAAEAAARATRDLQLKAATLAAERRFLPEQRRDRSAAAAIDAVARVLPDDTWLTGLTLDGALVRIQGTSAAADRLIQAIDAAPEFTDARFAAPLIKVQNAASERFDITFRRRSGAPR